MNQTRPASDSPNESALPGLGIKHQLWWMVEEARAAGLRIDDAMFRHLVFGAAHPRGRHTYEQPDIRAKMHDSMTPAWKVLGWLPRRARLREWPLGASRSGWYLPKGEPRAIPDGALIHRSALLRMKTSSEYRPVNVVEERLQEEIRAFDPPNGPASRGATGVGEA